MTIPEGGRAPRMATFPGSQSWQTNKVTPTTLWKNQCYKCKGLGHWAIACDAPVPTSSRSLPIGQDRCTLCNAVGHWRKDCPSKMRKITEDVIITPHLICSKWNRDTRSCDGKCNLLHICSHIRCRRATDRHLATHIQHPSD